MIKNERGFTIMELLVVIVIIGVLAAIGVPAYNNMTNKARKTACQVNQRTLQTAVGMFYADTGRYPTSIGELSSGGTAEAPLDKYIDDTTGFKCPLTKGAYFFNTDTNKIECTETDHNL